MAIQVIGTKKCNETKKVLRFFKERGVAHHFVDLNERSLSDGELDNIFRFFKPDFLIDRNSSRFKKRGFEFMDFDAQEELREDNLLLKLPIVRDKGLVSVGYSPDELKRFV